MSTKSASRRRSKRSRRTARTRRTERSGRAERSEPVSKTLGFRLGRVLFGGVLAFMALDNFRSLQQSVEYARASGVPMPSLTVPGISATLLSGGVGLAAWKYPRLAGGAVASFFLAVTPLMHDFWNEEGEERQQQQIHFLKNMALLGAALAFLRLGEREKST